MSEIDYEELIRSPLDDLDDDTSLGWAATLGGAVVGAAVAMALAFALGGTDGGLTSETLATTSSATAATGPPPVAADFPVGYTELAAGIAANIGEVIVDDDLVVVAFTTALARGSDAAAATWPIGGSWVLESASGTVAESSRVVVGRFSPGGFTVQFPADAFNGATDFVTVRAIERWDQERLAGSVSLPFGGEPFVSPELLTIPVSQDVTLVIPSLKLGRFLGSVEWATSGTPLGASFDVRVTLLDGDGEVIGTFARFPEILDPSDGGVVEIRWGPPFPTDQQGAETAVVDYTVTVPMVTPVSIEFDLTAVPLGR